MFISVIVLGLCFMRHISFKYVGCFCCHLGCWFMLRCFCLGVLVFVGILWFVFYQSVLHHLLFFVGVSCGVEAKMFHNVLLFCIIQIVSFCCYEYLHKPDSLFNICRWILLWCTLGQFHVTTDTTQKNKSSYSEYLVIVLYSTHITCHGFKGNIQI